MKNICILTKYVEIGLIFADLCRASGFAGYYAKNVEGAEALIRKVDFSGIIADCNLDGETSEAFIRKLITEGFRGVIIGTATRQEDLQKMWEAGCHLISQKHESINTLFEALSNKTS